jgi:hypothetical protein
MPTHGKTDALVSLPKYIEAGQLLGVTVTAGGTGYTNGAAVAATISGGGGTGATATALVVGGVIQSITVTNPGAGYTSDPTVTVATGTGATYLIKRAPLNIPHAEIILVDDVEASLESNKSKGINAPGWWWYKERVDSNGDPRYYAQLLAVITGNTTGATGDKEEDLVAADLASAVTITVQPTNQTTVTGGATFSVTATITGGGSLTYQWQLAPAATPTKFANVAGATAASLVLSGRTGANTGDKYRVIVAGGGAKRVVSSSATLTFGT